MDNEIKELKIYELGYLLVPSIAEEAVEGEVSAIKDVLAKHGASFISEEAPTHIDLAYTIIKSVSNKNHRYDSAYFGWIKFETTPESMERIKKDIDANISIIRSLLIKTVRENTVLTKRVPRKARPDAIEVDESETEAELASLPQGQDDLGGETEPVVDESDSSVEDVVAKED
mgnify:CR=1 FL=1